MSQLTAHSSRNRFIHRLSIGRTAAARSEVTPECHSAIDQLGHHCGQPINSTLGPAVFDRNALTLNVTYLAQPSDKALQLVSSLFAGAGIHKTNHRHWRLLCARRERPCNCRAAE
jgi:hypothetical protein